MAVTANVNKLSKIVCKLGLSIAVIALIACEQKATENNFLQTYNEQLVIPAYIKLADATESNQLVTQQCSEQNLEQFLPKAKDSWRGAMAAWQEAKVIGFGPISDQRIDWEFQFWPDKKNLVAKKAIALLKQDQPLSQETLASSSVVLHGLSALEFLLFDPSAQAKAAPGRLCELVIWIGDTMHGNAQKLQSEWQVHSKEFVNPSPEAETYTSETIAVGKVVDSYLVALDEIGKQKIGQVIGEDSASAPKPYFLESWRSQNSWQNMASNLVAINRLFNEGGLLNYLELHGHTDLKKELEAKLLVLNHRAAAVQPPLFSALEEQASALRSLQVALFDLRDLIKLSVTKALDLPIGFNDNDGD